MMVKLAVLNWAWQRLRFCQSKAVSMPSLPQYIFREQPCFVNEESDETCICYVVLRHSEAPNRMMRMSLKRCRLRARLPRGMVRLSHGEEVFRVVSVLQGEWKAATLFRWELLKKKKKGGGLEVISKSQHVFYISFNLSYTV